MDDVLYTLTNAANRIFLVYDGAVTPDLRREFGKKEFEVVPLFKDGTDPQIQDSGPWVVQIDPPLPRLMYAYETAEANQVGVLWAADCSLSDIVRHLRSLNVAQLPDTRIVYFRHYDPDALASLVEMLDAEQAAKLFGPAVAMGFASGCGAGQTLSRPDDLPAAKPGMIMFSDQQLETIKQRNVRNSRKKIENFLRFSYHDELAHKSDADIKRFVEVQERDARSLGLSTEREIALWAHIAIATRGQSFGDKAMADSIRAAR